MYICSKNLSFLCPFHLKIIGKIANLTRVGKTATKHISLTVGSGRKLAKNCRTAVAWKSKFILIIIFGQKINYKEDVKAYPKVSSVLHITSLSSSFLDRAMTMSCSSAIGNTA